MKNEEKKELIVRPASASNPGFAQNLLQGMAFITFIGGLFSSILLANQTGTFTFSTFLISIIIFGLSGCVFIAMAEVAGNIKRIADSLQDMRIIDNSPKDVEDNADNKKLTKQMDQLIRYLAVPPDTKGMRQAEAIDIIKQKGFEPILNNRLVGNEGHIIIKEWSRATDDPMKIYLQNERDIPDVIGMNMGEALACLEAQEYAVEILPKAVIDATKDNKVIEVNEKDARFFLSTGVLIPDLSNMNRDQAVHVFESKGFKVVVNEEYNNKVSENEVISWKNDFGKEIKLYVSKGPWNRTSTAYRVEYDETLDSPGDLVKAHVIMKRDSQMLCTELTITQRSNHQYKVPEQAKVSVDDDAPIQVIISGSGQIMKKDEPCKISFSRPWKDTKLPTKISVDMEMLMDETTYDQMNYLIEAEW